MTGDLPDIGGGGGRLEKVLTVPVFGSRISIFFEVFSTFLKNWLFGLVGTGGVGPGCGRGGGIFVDVRGEPCGICDIPDGGRPR